MWRCSGASGATSVVCRVVLAKVSSDDRWVVSTGLLEDLCKLFAGFDKAFAMVWGRVVACFTWRA